MGRALAIRVPYYIGHLKRDPSLDNYPHGLGFRVPVIMQVSFQNPKTVNPKTLTPKPLNPKPSKKATESPKA